MKIQNIYHTYIKLMLLYRHYYFYLSLYPLSLYKNTAIFWIFNFSTDSSIDLDCSLENDDANYLLQQSSSTLQLPAQHPSKAASGNSTLDKPFGMDLSVEFGGHSNRSSVVSQVNLNKFLLKSF